MGNERPIMKIMAVDPGGSTGIATLTTSSFQDNATNGEIEVLDHLGPQEHHYELDDLLGDYYPDTIVCENFQYRKQDNVDLISCEYIGVIKLHCQINGILLQMQTPSQAKNFWTIDKLKALDLWDSKKAPHGMDALRHLLYWLTYNKGDTSFLMKLK